MSAPGTPRPLAEWLRAAFADEAAGCPPPEAFLADEQAALSPTEQRALADHLTSCPACAAERELAQAFDAGSAGLAGEDVDWVLSRLRGAPADERQGEAGSRPPARLVSFPVRRPLARWRALAAAAALLLAVGLVRWLYPPLPPLPAPPAGGVLRGGEVSGLVPAGEVDAPPWELQWQPVAGAARYRVCLVIVDETPIWEAEVAAPPARLPAAVTSRLQRAVSYPWSVEALGPDGRLLARSTPARFRVRPTPEDEP